MRRLMVGLLVLSAAHVFGGGPEVHHGVLDLRSFDVSKSITEVKGTFGFQWGQWLDPRTDPSTLASFLKVPGNWNQVNPRLPAQGIATYAVRLLLPPGDTIWAFRLTPLNSACRLFINGRLMASEGTPSRDPSGEQPQASSRLVFFSAPTGVADLVFQMSNWNYRKGGLWSAPSVGTDTLMRADDDQRLLGQITLIGCLLVIAFYHLTQMTFQGLRRRRFQKAALWIVLIGFELVARALTTGDQLGVRLFGWDWEWCRKLEFFPLNLGGLLAYGISKAMYPDEIGPRMSRLWVAGSLLLGIPEFLPGRISNNFVEVWEIFSIAYLACVQVVLWRAAQRGRPGAQALAWGSLGLLLADLNDSLRATYNLAGWDNLFPITLFVYFLLMSFYLSQQHQFLEGRVELLSNDLEGLQKTLRRFVPVSALPDLMMLCDFEGRGVQSTAALDALLSRGPGNSTDLFSRLPGWPQLPEIWSELKNDGKPRFGIAGRIDDQLYWLSLVPLRDQTDPEGRVLARLTAQKEHQAGFDRFGLSPREREVCLLLFEGLTNQEIAERLFLSAATIKTHLQNLFRKTQTSTRVALLVALSQTDGRSDETN